MVRLPSAGGDEEAGEEEEVEQTGPYWFFLPVAEHLDVDGVEAAARVGRYGINTRLSGGRQSGTVIGIDRVDFPKVAFWRRDFAPRTLGALMNTMAYKPNAVLASRPFMAQHALRVGDTFRMYMSALGEAHEFDVEIVGSFSMFPTWYPDEGPLFVISLDYLFEQAGGQFPYDVWVKTDAPVSGYEQLVADMKDKGFVILDWDAPRADIAQEQEAGTAGALRSALGGLRGGCRVDRARLPAVRALLLPASLHRVRHAARDRPVVGPDDVVPRLGAGLPDPGGDRRRALALGPGSASCSSPILQIGGAGAASQIPPFVVEIAWAAIIQHLCPVRGVLRGGPGWAGRDAAADEDLPGGQAGRDGLMESEPFIICDNLVKIYKVADLEIVALQGLDLVVAPRRAAGHRRAERQRQVAADEHPGRPGPSVGGTRLGRWQ